jgi:heavy metal sensor kinase
LAVGLALFAVAIFFTVRFEVYDSFEEELHQRAAAAQAALWSGSDELSTDPATLAKLRDDEHFVRVVAPDGRAVIDTSQDVGVPASDPSLIAEVLAGHARLSKISGPEGRFWVSSTPIYRDGVVTAVFEFGASSEDENDLMRLLILTFAFAAPVLLILASGGGYVLARRSLKPVSEITNLAASLDGDELGTRLNLDLPDDELGRLSRTFDGMLGRIEGAFNRQRQFTGDAAHELRTPLTFMRNQVDITLARDRSIEEYQAALHGLDGDIARLTGLVSTLFTLARSDSGNLPIDRAAVRIDEVIRSLIQQYEPRAESSQVHLIVQSSPATVSADEDLLMQALINVVDNALAHTPEDGVITVGNRMEGESVLIWVADNGDGIAQEHLDRVFDRFYRVDSGRTRREGGAGLGLSLVRPIVAAHGGTVSIASSPGRGTRVTIALPGAEATL